ncbi:hypothetical protein AMJ40_03705 [candidate division TA06 bacterium DG_26]|uniref:KOW domain-containing protein n=1 Tax=candidate division TA06 bacterium DG_26 TaxID=1703771 RepID=A0A0S7WJ88_UNCT6|nr:MAG: hypothetical protein AMJ40_03705 [candidate division TA06 bacterium DG_26]
MAHAYTPGLKISERTKIKKERRLPLPGEVVVSLGDSVKADTIVARTNLPGNVQTMNVAGLLGILPEDIRTCMLKKEGDPVKKGDAIAETKGLFGLFKSKATAPEDGSIESVSHITGQVIFREPPIPVEVSAYIDGEVVEVFEKEGVAVETMCALVQGIFGIGGEAFGELKRAVGSPEMVLTPGEIDKDCRGKVLIGGSLITVEAVKKAVELGAHGIVAGGIADQDLSQFLGYDIGVAITGSEEKGITLIVTEGFGRLKMAEKTFRLLSGHEGKKASINGTTQIRAGVIRPEVVVPLDSRKEAAVKRREYKEGLEVGSPVRVIREPHFGQLGKVVALPPELRQIETGAKVRVLDVELEGGATVTLPRANVEMLEE